jgi:hypothetical protein
MTWEGFEMKWWKNLLADKPELAFWLKWFTLFLMLFISIAAAALYNIVSAESNPFFYAKF